MDIQKVNSLLDVVSGKIIIYKQIKAELNKNHALDFNPIEMFFPLGENKLSQILTFFLNPVERHQQGDIYVIEFLRYLDFVHQLDLSNNFKAITHIRTEQPALNSRRIDIYFTYSTYDNRHNCIAIENKIWAVDQENQIKDYLDFIKNQNFNDFKLFYLTPNTRNPTEWSITKSELENNKDKIKLLDHSEFTINLLEKWVSITRPQPIRDFLIHTVNFLKKEINNIKFMDMEQSIIDAITPDKLEAAFAIHSAIQPLKNDIARKFQNNVIDQLKKKILGNKYIITGNTRADLINIAIVDDRNVSIEIRDEQDEYGLWYGVRLMDADVNKRREFYNKINLIISGKVEDTWFWFPFGNGDLQKAFRWYDSIEEINYMRSPETIKEAVAKLNELIIIVSKITID